MIFASQYGYSKFRTKTACVIWPDVAVGPTGGSVLPAAAGPAAATRSSDVISIVEFDEPCRTIVLDDVVAVESVAVTVEIIFAFGADEFLGRQDRLAYFARLGRVGGFYFIRKDADRVERPRTLTLLDRINYRVLIPRDTANEVAQRWEFGTLSP